MNANRNNLVKVLDLGFIDYQEAWDYQASLFQSTVDLKIQNRKQEKEELTPNYLLYCSHPHVYTLGKSGNMSNLLIGDAARNKKEISFYRINRGGDITYHGPGQLVGYPIIDLENFFTDIHLYLRKLEECVIRTLGDYGIRAGRIEGLTGVWLDIDKQPRKICALGVKTSRWVTMHGFAFNLNVDLDFYQHIVPCGIQDKDVTSLHVELGKPVDENEVKSRLTNHFLTLFQMETADGK